ncbi:hypothetical protein BVH03_24970 [Pseudomonas sp. PA15(2017)]|uniref:gp53-like domain-containing protein n=1 Tax=Pseudomonas sp. PA15(2017) TaxID=1932111 RepID=UPI00095D3436|nr:phage tail protein [Pseudomonas sp. PA15(2017)]OLU22481.1 hypothetical protein BVH03_24970 [Pseudomonas sp. PA15(2017)]
MALPITITDAGRAEIIAAENTGTAKVTIAAVALGTGRYSPSKSQTALQAEIKRLSSIAGTAVADDTIHVMALDESSATYDVGEFGLISDKGTLIAVYSQLPAEGWIIQKAPASTLLLATDIILESLGTAAIQFGDVAFINPPATTTVAGVVMLEDSLTSTSHAKALTARQGKALAEALDTKANKATSLAGYNITDDVQIRGKAQVGAFTVECLDITNSEQISGLLIRTNLPASSGLMPHLTFKGAVNGYTSPFEMHLSWYFYEGRFYIPLALLSGVNAPLSGGLKVFLSSNAGLVDIRIDFGGTVYIPRLGVTAYKGNAYGGEYAMYRGWSREPRARELAIAGEVEVVASTALNTNNITAAALSLAAHGVIPLSAVTGLVAALDAKAPLHSPGFSGAPTAPTPPLAVSNNQLATTEFVMRAFHALVDSSPEALNTLRELAAAIGDDPNFATTMVNALAGKLSLSGGTMTGTILSQGGSTAVIDMHSPDGTRRGYLWHDADGVGFLGHLGGWALRVRSSSDPGGYGVSVSGVLRGDGSGLFNVPLAGVAGLAEALASKLGRGEYGLGGSAAPVGAIDTIGLPGGFYYFGEGATSFAPYVGLVNIPYGSAGYAGQLGFQQGTAEPRVLVRSVVGAGQWTPTREVYHSGNFNPAVKLDLAGGRMAGRLVIATDQGATPNYGVNQLELSDAGAGTPVTLGFHREGLTATLLTHRGAGLEVLANGGGGLAPLAALLNGSNIVAGTVSATHLDTAVRGVNQGPNNQDPNLAVTPVILSNHANTPDSAYYWHISTTFYAGIGEATNRGQIAVQYTPLADGSVRVFARSSYQGAWSAWTRCDLGGAPRSTANLGSTGWWRCADTGLIRQWGQTGNIGNDGGVTITLPVTFPNAMLGAHAAGMRGPDSTNGPSMLTTNWARATFAIYNDAAASPANWEAWGY